MIFNSFCFQDYNQELREGHTISRSMDGVEDDSMELMHHLLLPHSSCFLSYAHSNSETSCPLVGGKLNFTSSFRGATYNLNVAIVNSFISSDEEDSVP